MNDDELPLKSVATQIPHYARWAPIPYTGKNPLTQGFELPANLIIQIQYSMP